MFPSHDPGEQCFLGAEEQHLDINMNFMTVPMPKDGIPKGKKRIKISDFSKKVKPMESKTYKDSNKLMHILYIYTSLLPINNLEGDPIADNKKGIYHFTLGADEGLVKSINFKKTDQPYVAEYRATSNTEQSKRLRDKYDISMRMVGNTLFRPGMYIYIDSDSLGDLGRLKSKNSISRALGLGGYYTVVKISHITSADDYETEIDARWTAFPEKKGNNPNKWKKVEKRSDKLSHTRNLFENYID